MKKAALLFLLLGTFALNSGSTFHQNETLRHAKDYALFFAVNDYDHWEDLTNPISDVEAIAKDLKDLYGFETEIVRNPDRKAILDKIEEYRKKTYAQDAQLLIFFSGHGEFNEDSKQGYFVPKNGQKDDTYGDSYIEYEGLKRRISSLPCEHILLALDACYSGTADESIAMRGEPGKRPGAGVDAERERYIAGALQYRSRIMLTSGAKVRTPDKSQFAAKFLEALRARGGQDGLLNTPELLGYLTTAMPKPVATQFGDHAPGGEFLFVLEGAPNAAEPKSSETSKIEDKTAADITAWKKAGQLNIKSAYREYQKTFCPGGAYCDVAEVRVAKFLEEDKKAWDSAKGANTIKSLQKYLDDYPEGEHRAQAQAVLQSEDILWQQTVEKSTKESFSAYLKAFPSGKYRRDAEEGIKKIDWAQPVTPTDLQHDMVFVKSGTFTMGCTPEQGNDCDDNEKPAHQVTVGDFYIGRYEVTQKQWRQVMGTDEWWSSWECDECPINKVTWNQVQDFIKK
ncbi:MAG TPA: caspase family protein, partial [Saprospiraceae bacterium]|nr:caspase family protein [Saprospiraceae bacterium]